MNREIFLFFKPEKINKENLENMCIHISGIAEHWG